MSTFNKEQWWWWWWWWSFQLFFLCTQAYFSDLPTTSPKLLITPFSLFFVASKVVLSTVDADFSFFSLGAAPSRPHPPSHLLFLPFLLPSLPRSNSLKSIHWVRERCKLPKGSLGRIPGRKGIFVFSAWKRVCYVAATASSPLYNDDWNCYCGWLSWMHRVHRAHFSCFNCSPEVAACDVERMWPSQAVDNTERPNAGLRLQHLIIACRCRRQRRKFHGLSLSTISCTARNLFSAISKPGIERVQSTRRHFAFAAVVITTNRCKSANSAQLEGTPTIL